MFDNVRAYILTELDLPAAWRKVDEQRIPEVIDRETVVLKHSRVEKLPEAPIGQLRHEVILGIFVPNQDLARAENRLDEAVTELIAEIDGHRHINWRSAEKVIGPGNQYPGWEITLTVNTQKPDPTPAPPESE